MGLTKKLGLEQNPFEHYTAESEKDIDKYAVRPLYLEYINDRILGLSSFILFGERGAGKSATRITLYKKFWERVDKEEHQPFLVNLTDYKRLQALIPSDQVDDKKVIDEVVFNTLEQLIIWLSSLTETKRESFITSIGKEDRTLILALMKGFYLKIPELDRQHSNDQALRSIASSLKEKGGIWASQNWDTIKQTFSKALSSLIRSKIDEGVDIEDASEKLLGSFEKGEYSSPAVILGKLNECIKMFGFSGTCILVDKLDETETTNNSAERTARLIHPVLSHIQLIEIPDFSWVFFIWKDVKLHFNGENLNVRLDKIANTDISWTNHELRKMIENRVDFYSEGRLSLTDLFYEEDNGSHREIIGEIIKTSHKSPRELIKIMDTIIREHDSIVEDEDEDEDEHYNEVVKITYDSVDQGIDKYCTSSIDYWYDSSMLHQVYRLGKNEFTNHDVQSSFKISNQGARAKIIKWKEAGIVKQDGTTFPPGGKGKGQPTYKYKIHDPRVRRIIDRYLVDTVGISEEEEEEG